MSSIAENVSSWDDLIAEFRALGGIFGNITLRQGARGRGLFPIEPTKPIEVKVPPNLLVPSKDVEIRGGQLVAKPSAALGERERAFFERYQRDLGWGAGVFDELQQEQLEWSRLPLDIQTTLREISLAAFMPFLFRPPDENSCLERYLSTREYDYGGQARLMPFVELVNCSSEATTSYVNEDGIAVRGKFDGEILVEYNVMDCWDRAVFYGFLDTTVHAYSVAFKYQSVEDGSIQIHKSYRQKELLGKIALPAVHLAQDGTAEISHLLLGSARQPRLPRGIFQHISKNLPLKRPDEMFDVIQHYNRVQLLRFLQISEGILTPLVTRLRRAAYQQLTTLSHCFGSVSLATGI